MLILDPILAWCCLCVLSQIVLTFMQIVENMHLMVQCLHVLFREETQNVVMDFTLGTKNSSLLSLALVSFLFLLITLGLTFCNGVLNMCGLQVSTDPLLKPNFDFSMAWMEVGQRKRKTFAVE